MSAWDKIFEDCGIIFKDPHPKMKELLELFQKKNFNNILDLGCGTGRHLVFFSQHGFTVYGFDSSPNALKLANKWLESANLTAQTFLHKVEEPFPFDDKFFDAIISIQVIHHNKLVIIKKTVKEIERVTIKGGLIFISIPLFHEFSRKTKWKLKEIEKGTYIPLNGPEKGLPHHFFSKREIVQIFQNFKILDMGSDSTAHRFFLAEKL